MARIRAVAAAILPLLAAAPASAADPTANDPYEYYNRLAFGWSAGLSTGLLGAVAAQYDATVPEPVRGGVHNVIQTLREPVYAAAGLVTADASGAWNAAARFTLNATLGRLGTEDVASRLGYPSRIADLGSELCRAGVLTDAAFIEVPLIGPSTTRDAAARLATNVALYLAIGNYYYPYYAIDLLDRYMTASPAAPAAPVAAGADTYLAQRDAYLLRRAAACRADPGG